MTRGIRGWLSRALGQEDRSIDYDSALQRGIPGHPKVQCRIYFSENSRMLRVTNIRLIGFSGTKHFDMGQPDFLYFVLRMTYNRVFLASGTNERKHSTDSMLEFNKSMLCTGLLGSLTSWEVNLDLRSVFVDRTHHPVAAIINFGSLATLPSASQLSESGIVDSVTEEVFTMYDMPWRDVHLMHAPEEYKTYLHAHDIDPDVIPGQ